MIYFNIRCLFSFHKWRFYNKVIELKPTIYLPIKKFNSRFRICDKCYKKEREVVDYHRPHKEWTWVKSDLSKDELRDKKIKELLKRNERR
jgi:hypothetical protein